MTIILLLLGLILDGVLSIYIPTSSYFLPLITVSTLFLIYSKLQKKEKLYFIEIAVAGIIYDILYTNLLFFHLIIFFCLGIIIKYLYKTISITPLKLLFHIILLITIYELLIAISLLIFRIVPITIPKLTYKITHSIILNTIYAELIYFLTNIKYKKKS